MNALYKGTILIFILFNLSVFESFAQNPVYAWNFDNNVNDSQGTMDGTMVGTGYTYVNDQQANHNGALKFDMTNTHLDLAGSKSDLSFISNSGVFSLSVDVKFENLSSTQILLGNWGSHSHQGFYLILMGGKVGFLLGAGTGVSSDFRRIYTNNITDQDWHNVTVIGDGEVMTIYLDGVYQEAITIQDFPFPTGDNTNNVYVGAANNAGSPVNPLLNGTLDNLAIYNQAIGQRNGLNFSNTYFDASNDPQLPAEVVHSWKLDGALHDSKADLNGIRLGTQTSYVQDKDGNPESALQFENNSNSYINLVDSKSAMAYITNTGVFSLSVDVKFENLSADQMLIGNWANHSQKGFYLGLLAGQVNFLLGPGTGVVTDFKRVKTQTITDQNWHQITVTGDGSFLTIYLDGEYQEAIPIEDFQFTTGANTNDLFIGALNNSVGPASPLANGTLDNITLYNQAIIVSNPSPGGGTIPACNNLDIAHYWSFDNSVTDGVGNINTVRLGSQTEFVADKDANSMSALKFGNVSDSYLHLLGSKSDLSFISNTATFSLSVNIKFDNLSSDQMLMGNWLGTTHKGFYLRFVASEVQFLLGPGTGQTSDYLTVKTGAIADNDWHNIIVTGDGNFLTIYLDGQQEDAVSLSAYPFQSGDDSFDVFVGAVNNSGNPTHQFRNGTMDDLTLYQVGLTTEQINSIWNGGCGVSPSTSGSLWSVSQGTQNIYYTEGTVSIGTETNSEGFSLAVKERILTEGVKVKTYENWPDYVFYEGYPLMSLEELEVFLSKKGHLPEIPTADEVKKNGFNIELISALLLEKIEEQSLYLINQNKRISKLEKQSKELMKQNQKLLELLQKMTKD